MSSAHVFYIPVTFMVGLLFGYFAGRQAAEHERKKKRKRVKRRKQMNRNKRGEDEPDESQED